MATNEPTFPLEIFNRIIDIIGDQSSTIAGSGLLESIHQQERLTTLQACSLVCSAFEHFTRPYIFQSANVGFNEDTTSERRLHQLMIILDTKPEYMRHIRHIHFDFNNTYPGPLMSHCRSENLAHYTDLLLNIPDLRSLSLSYSYATYDPEDYLSTPEVTNFCEDVIEAYAGPKLGTLRSLHAKKIRVLPFPTIFGCESLHTLSLDRCQWPILQAPIPQLLTLKLRKIVAPVPILSLLYLPNLKDLILDQSYFDAVANVQDWDARLKGTEADLRPPFRLSTLVVLTSADQLDKIIPLLQYYGERHNVEPFKCISSLSTSVERLTAQSVPNFGSMMPSLRYLSLAVNGSAGDQEPSLGILNLKLAENMSTGGALASLVSLTLRVKTYPKLNPYYLTMITSLATFLSSVTPDCNLRYLTVGVKVPFNAHASKTTQVSPSVPLATRSTVDPVDSGHGDGTMNISRSQESNTSIDFETLFWSSLLSLAGNCINLPRFQTLTLEVTYTHTGPRNRQSQAPEPDLKAQRNGRGDFSVVTTVRNKEWEDSVVMERIYDLQRAIMAQHSSKGIQFIARVEPCEQTVFSVRRATIIIVKNTITSQ